MNARLPKLIYLGLCVLLLLSGCSSPTFVENQIAENIYGYTYPAVDAGSRDVVILLCGGSGFHEQYTQIAQTLTENNFQVVLIDYYAGGEDWGGNGIDTPETLERYHQNVRDGIDWIINDSGMEPEHLYLLGFSYGATIGINIAAERDDIDALVDFYGDMNMGIHNNQAPAEFVPQLPPLMLIYGDQDRVVGQDEGQQMIDLLTQYNIPHQEWLIPGMSHGFVTDQANADVVAEGLDKTIVWFREFGK